VGSNDYPGFFASRQIYDRDLELPDWTGLPAANQAHEGSQVHA